MSCAHESGSPEELTRRFVELVSTGRCEEAKKLTTGNGSYEVQGWIDAGCNPFTTEIVDVHCKIEADTAWCCCHERREGYLLYQHYDLEKKDGKWLVSNQIKDFFILRCWAENPWWEK